VQRNGFGSFRFIDTTNIARVEVVKRTRVAPLWADQSRRCYQLHHETSGGEAGGLFDRQHRHGRYDRGVVDATGPVPGMSNKLLYRAIAMYEDIPGIQTASTGHKVMYAPSLTWNIADVASLTLDYEHFERRDKMPTSGVPLVSSVARDHSYPGCPGLQLRRDGDYQDFILTQLRWS